MRRAATLDLALPSRDLTIPAYRWVYGALRAEILEGRLRPGAQLPGTRDLADQYGLSRGTIVSGYELLKSEGYVEGSVGSGTHVSRVLPDDLLNSRREAVGHARVRRRNRRWTSDYGGRVRPFPLFGIHGTARAFRTNQPALDLFPMELWAQITARRLRRVSTKLLLGCSPLGYPPLRETVADYLRSSRGVRCTSEQVVILSGVQEALDLVARLFLDPGDRVCIEDPGYVGATVVFDAVGAKVTGVPVDDEGMELPSESLRGSKLVYVTPAHQFPLGITMSLQRRLMLLEWARKSDALIFEDDYDSEFRFSGCPVPALQGLDQADCVLLAGSFSKVLFPSLRLGYLVIPLDLVPLFAAIKSVTSRHVPLLEQAVLCDFIADGHFGRHVRRMREVYAERLTALLEGARERLTGLLEISNVEAGLQSVGWLGGMVNGQAAAEAAAARGVETVPLSRYTRKQLSREGLQVGFAAVGVEEIRHGVRELAAALETLPVSGSR